MRIKTVNNLRLAFSILLIFSSIATFAYSFIYGQSFDQYFYLARHQNLIGNILITLVFYKLSYLGYSPEFIAGTFDFKLHLPLHLCRFANLLLPIILFWKNDKIFQILYFGGCQQYFKPFLHLISYTIFLFSLL